MTNMEIAEALNLQQQGEEKQNNLPLREFKEVVGTPFQTVREETGVYMIMGGYRISEKRFESEEDCIYNELEAERWHTIGKMIFAVVDMAEKMREEETKDKFENDKKAL